MPDSRPYGLDARWETSRDRVDDGVATGECWKGWKGADVGFQGRLVRRRGIGSWHAGDDAAGVGQCCEPGQRVGVGVAGRGAGDGRGLRKC